MDIGNELKTLRKKLGLTQSELAKKCNLSKNSIWNYENNKRTPTIDVLRVIGEALGIDLGYLIASPSVVDINTANNLVESGLAREITKNIDIDYTQQIVEFNRFLASAQLPFDIPFNELEQVYKKTIDFLKYEFFKLGYVEVKNNKDR